LPSSETEQDNIGIVRKLHNIISLIHLCLLRTSSVVRR